MLIVWKQKFLAACMIFVTNMTIRSTSAKYSSLKHPILKPLTHDKLISNMFDVTSDVHLVLFQKFHSLNVCAPGVNRAALCEAITELLKLGPIPNENEPCIAGYNYTPVYVCRTLNGMVLRLWSEDLENSILVAVKNTIVVKFNIDVENVQLLDADFINYTRFTNWQRLAQRSRVEILSGLEEAQLTPLYETAAQLHVRKVNPPETIPKSIQSSSAGFDICERQVNRGLLCQAINVRYYGETFWVQNEFQCDEGKFFECPMRNGETLLLRKGNYPYSVFVMDQKDKFIHFIAFIIMAKDTLTSKFLPKVTSPVDPEPDESASEDFYPHQDTLPVHDHPNRADLEEDSV